MMLTWEITKLSEDAGMHVCYNVVRNLASLALLRPNRVIPVPVATTGR